MASSAKALCISKQSGMFYSFTVHLGCFDRDISFLLFSIALVSSLPFLSQKVSRDHLFFPYYI